MNARLIGIGVGPGDPELLTLKGARALAEADVVFVPVAEGGETGRAEAIAAAHVPAERLRRLGFSLAEDEAARAASWAAAAAEVAAALRGGGAVAFATIGDPNVYSTFAYVAARVRRLVPGLLVETVPGITAMQDLAARTSTVLCQGRERLALLPFTAGAGRLAEALAAFDTVVCYKGGRQLPEVLSVIERAGRLEHAVYGARLGLPGEEIRPAASLLGSTGPYLSTVIISPSAGARRQG